MNTSPITITPKTARRLAIHAQLLDKIPENPDKDNILAIIRKLGCLQIDPINVVARSPLLVLFSRLNGYDIADFETLMWTDRVLFEYWAHAASVVLVEDFPIHQVQMINFIASEGSWHVKKRRWMAVNEPFRQYILTEIARRGPLYASEFEDRSIESWQSTGWSNSRTVSIMLQLMWEQGDITVTNRLGPGFGLKKQWGLLQQHMPQWQDHEPWSQPKVVKEAAEIALKALGLGTEKHIHKHFIRGGYPDLPEVLAELEGEGRVHKVAIKENGDQWPGIWYMHKDAISDLTALQNGSWSKRTTLLSPFDNLIADRDRTELLFDYYYRSEIYTPKKKRVYGYYVLPILHGDSLIGRIDPKYDRKQKILYVHAVHAEEGAPDSQETGRDIARAIEELASFLGAEDIQYGDKLAPQWAKAFA